MMWDFLCVYLLANIRVLYTHTSMCVCVCGGMWSLYKYIFSKYLFRPDIIVCGIFFFFNKTMNAFGEMSEGTQIPIGLEICFYEKYYFKESVNKQDMIL